MIYLLDTNVCVAILRGHPAVVNRLRQCQPEDCGVSTITVFELFSGVQRCRVPQAEEKKVLAFLAPLHLLPFDWDAARLASKFRWELEKSGRMIGPYDLQIAAQAQALEVTLVTHNTREFEHVPGLHLEDWET